MFWESHGRRWRSRADTSIHDNAGAKSLQIDGKNHGGEVVFTGHADDDYIAQVSYTLNSGRDGALYVRYLDADNWYRVLLDYNAGTPKARLQLMLKGELSTLESVNYSDVATVTLKVKVAGSTIKSWVEGSVKNDVTVASDEFIPWSGVALSGWQARFDDLKVGYDNNADDDIDDGGKALRVAGVALGPIVRMAD